MSGWWRDVVGTFTERHVSGKRTGRWRDDAEQETTLREALALPVLKDGDIDKKSGRRREGVGATPRERNGREPARYADVGEHSEEDRRSGGEPRPQHETYESCGASLGAKRRDARTVRNEP